MSDLKLMLHHGRFGKTFSRKTKAKLFTESSDKIFLGNQPYQFRAEVQHFGDILCLHHQDLLL
jgi:hypothetical protein